MSQIFIYVFHLSPILIPALLILLLGQMVKQKVNFLNGQRFIDLPMDKHDNGY